MSLSFKARLTAWYVALLAIILLAFGLFLHLRLRTDLVAAIDRSLETRAAQISLTYERTGDESEFQGVSDASLVTVPRGETADQILTATGHVLQDAGDQSVARTTMIGSAALHKTLSGMRLSITAKLGVDREPFRILAVGLSHRGHTLVVAESLEGVDRSVHRLLVLMLLAGPAMLLSAGAGGWWLSRKALRPVRAMTDEAAAIGMDNLGERVAVPNTSDEIERLGRTLNGMLDRLEHGVAEKRRFLADASHELRTPLAVMRSEMEVSLGSPKLFAESREVLTSAVEEVDRMAGIVENLLTLARIDEGQLHLLREPVALADVADRVATKLRPFAEGKQIRLGVSGDGAFVQGDRERLYQAVANLVENAVKYTQAGGDVSISIWRRGPEAGLTVADTGPGIATESIPHIFNRFVRADSARSRGAGGSGLGLAICREIVEAHGGRVWAESEMGRGAAFSLALPTS